MSQPLTTFIGAGNMARALIGGLLDAGRAPTSLRASDPVQGSRDAAAALRELDGAVAAGVDVGQLAEQLLGGFRDMMAAAVGCDAELMLHATSDEFDALRETAEVGAPVAEHHAARAVQVQQFFHNGLAVFRHVAA